MNKLRLFQENDVESLYSMAKHLHTKTGFFATYLTVPQLSVLNEIFSPSLSKSTSRVLWQHLLNAKLLVKDDDNTSIASSEAMLLNSKSMSLRVRSLLWGKATSYYYHLSDSRSTENEVFDILEGEDSDFEDAPLNPDPSSSQTQRQRQLHQLQPLGENAPIAKLARDADEDDDYDEDEDEDEGDKKGVSADGESGQPEGNAVDPARGNTHNEEFQYYNDYLILDITTTQQDNSVSKTGQGNNLNNANSSTYGPGSTYGNSNNSSSRTYRSGKPTLTTSKMSTSLNSSDTIVTTQELAIIKSLNNVYHSFENDRETLLKRQKLEANDKIVNEEPTGSAATKNRESQSLASQLSMNIGSASLSLKYLLKLIDNNRDKVPNLTSRELRNLIHDVKKSKSKWSSEDRIGQEELYEACEKVVIELRSYTQHSTPFLTKVSKREAPNYYQIIKKPMDLNTVMKKLKNLDYKSKLDFINDLMLIWQNCLTYNTDPNHQLRKDAIAMRKKTMSLIPLIPDITIRTKSEIEKEEKELERQQQKRNQAKSHGGQVSSKKGLKRTSNGNVVTHIESASPQGTPAPNQPSSTLATNTPEPSGASNIGDDDANDSQAEAFDNEGGNGNNNNNDLFDIINDNEFNEELNDLEIQVWKNYTSKLRGDFLLRRSNLFLKDENKELQLNADAEAILRDPKKMSEFVRVVARSDVSDTRKINEGDNEAGTDGQADGHANNSGQSNLETVADLKDSSDNENDDNGINDDLYLTEYDIINGVPLISYKGQDEEFLSQEENKLLEKLKFQRKLKSESALEEEQESEFVSPKNGLNKFIVDNITQMQEIRKICFKISLIRQMQQNQFIHHTQLKAPVFEKLKDFDLDPLEKKSENVIFDHKFNGQFIYNIFRKNISKILMNTGFETADPAAVDSIAQIAESFLGNLIKTIKLHIESLSENKITSKSNILLLSLVENGIPKPDDLFIYINEGIIKQNFKLKELRGKLANFLKELLRPSLMSFQSEKDLINEKNFTDNSEQFLTGDFSNELGEDFFGFRELGLDKEFHLLSSSIPLHLLNSKLNSTFFNPQSASATSKSLIEEFDKNVKYNRIYKQDISKQVKLAQPFLNTFFEKSKLIYLKNFKNNNTTNKELPFTNREEEMAIMEDEDLPQKQRNIRPRLPPNGKITVAKKKTVGNGFFLSEDDNSGSEDEKKKMVGKKEAKKP